MKSKNQELDVDFIQSKPLAKAEEKALSEYIKKLKIIKNRFRLKEVIPLLRSN